MSDGREPRSYSGMEVAIVGMAGRFPGARNVEELWRNLCGGVEAIKLFTDEELLARGADPNLLRSPTYVKAAFEIEDHDRFDAAFFGISPREAELIEPQQRLFLECAWQAIESAGYDPERLPRRVGIYAGSRFNGYLVNVYSNPAVAASTSDLQIQVANDKDYLATRLSYKLNLGGPSMTVQTACSTALVAIHLASQALLNGECDMALAGGVGIRIPEVGYPYTEGEVNSPDGHIRAFDAKARGTIFGSGLGLVVLKRLEDALADGDTIHALILGSAVTNDGSLKVGYTAPGVDGQARVVRAAQLAAEVDPETISYIEAHGTGTPVGDPIEISALTRVFREHTDRTGFCAIGSVKTNVGHLSAAAGVVGVIKTALALEHGVIPPSLNYDEPNPQIDFASSPFYVNTTLAEWKRNGGPRRAGVSAFGMGGTNAHVILEEAPEIAPSGAPKPGQLLVLSARTPTALEKAAAQLAGHLEAHPELNLGGIADIAYTLAVGRKRFPHRGFVVCRDREEAVEALRNPGASAFSEASDRPVAFLFSGQGSQYPGMATDLYETQPTFRAELDRCCELLRPRLGFDLRELLVRTDAEDAERRLEQTAVTQPALFVLEYCLARLWMEWGVVPRAMLGHSIGEYAAACLAGVFSLPDALALVAARGRLMQSLPPGAMLSVPLPAGEVQKRLAPPLSLAAVNAPGRSVVSGPEEAVEAFRRRLEEEGLSPRRLHTSHAFHSEMMEPILGPFLRAFDGVDLQPPQIPYVSNVTGTWITDDQATDPAYWARHLRQGVLFADGVRELLAEPGRLLLEVGPGNTLTTFATQHPDRSPEQAAISSLPHARDRQPARRALLKALGQLWMHGAEVDWAGLFAGERRLRVPLPTYPFEGERYWIEPGDLSAAMAGAMSGASAKRNPLDDWFYLPFWKPSLPLVLDAEPPSGRWLVFLDREGLGERLVERLRQAGPSPVTVETGGGFAQTGERAYTVSPARREDYDALLQSLAAAGELPDQILHLWNVGRRSCAARCPEVLADEERAFWSLLFLAQACGKHVKTPLRLAAVSSHMQRVAGEEHLCPGKATLLGPVRIIPLEYPNVQAASLDIVLPEDPAGLDDLAEWLLADVAAGLSDPVVAFRGRGRFLLDYQKVKIPPPAPERLRFRHGGTYLITGGLGGLGLVFAELLAREFQARLSLLGISPLPPREDWEAFVARHGEHHRVSGRIRKVQELEALGAEVLVLAVDVADEEQMRKAVAETRERFGDLHGVIHAAGLAGGGLIQLKTVETAARVLAPKVRGTLALDAALADQPLDFVLLCSSTISVLGGLGQVDYCAANSFLDAFAHARSLHGGTPVVSINWGAWQEVGMAVAAGLPGGPGDRPAPASDRYIHPLLDRCQREMAEQTIYETDFSAARQWPLAEHRVLGQPTLPGTSYLEMACAAFHDHASVFESRAGEAGVEIREALFLTPLRLDGSETRTVQTILEPDENGFAFRVVSRPPEGSGEGVQVHARGKVGPLAGEATERRDLDEIRRRCSEREVVITEPVMMSGEGLVYWGPRWQSLKRADIGPGEILALLELPGEHADDLGKFTLHPALLDVATSLMGFLKEGSHLPISYQRLGLRRPLPGRLYSHLRERTEAGEGRETVSVDVTLMDESGEVLVEIERFVLKQVTETSSLRRQAEPARTEKAPEPPAKVASRVDTSDGILSWEGVEVVRRVLSRGRDLPQVVASARDVQVLLAQIRAIDRGSLAERADARAPRAAHARPNLSTPFVAPRTPVEEQLALAFQQALGVQEVGVHDNFFDLGGDSIVGIQVVARANEAGLSLSPDQLFENQTIAELAKLISPSPAAPAAPAETVATTEMPAGEAAPFADSGLPPEELAKVLAKLNEMNP